MTRAAVALASASELPLRARTAPEPELQQQLTTLGRQIGYGRRFRPGRSQLLLVGLLILGLWLVLVFGRALTDLNNASERQQALAAESQALSQRLAAGRRELQLVQTDSFQRLQARAFGLGAPGELVFSLESGAPTAAPVMPLGGAGAGPEVVSPLDAWLRLLFGD